MAVCISTNHPLTAPRATFEFGSLPNASLNFSIRGGVPQIVVADDDPTVCDKAGVRLDICMHSVIILFISALVIASERVIGELIGTQVNPDCNTVLWKHGCKVFRTDPLTDPIHLGLIEVAVDPMVQFSNGRK